MAGGETVYGISEEVLPVLGEHYPVLGLPLPPSAGSSHCGQLGAFISNPTPIAPYMGLDRLHPSLPVQGDLRTAKIRKDHVKG